MIKSRLCPTAQLRIATVLLRKTDRWDAPFAPEKPFEIFEEDFTKTMMDYLMFKQGIDVKEFNNSLLKKVMYESNITSQNNNIIITINSEDKQDETNKN